MGEPMARNLLRAGHQLRIFDRTRARAAPLEDVDLALDAGRDATVAMPIAGVMRDQFLSAIADGWKTRTGPPSARSRRAMPG